MRRIAVLPLVLVLIVSLATGAAALDLGKLTKKKPKDLLKDAVKVAGIGFAIESFAEPINDFVNSLLLTRGVANKETTKVVPILTVGSKGHIGAAQVCGPDELVKQVKTVIQFEDDFKVMGKSMRVRALIPNAGINPLQLNRVYGVGVTAIIDLPL